MGFFIVLVLILHVILQFEYNSETSWTYPKTDSLNAMNGNKWMRLLDIWIYLILYYGYMGNVIWSIWIVSIFLIIFDFFFYLEQLFLMKETLGNFKYYDQKCVSNVEYNTRRDNNVTWQGICVPTWDTAGKAWPMLLLHRYCIGYNISLMLWDSVVIHRIHFLQTEVSNSIVAYRDDIGRYKTK